MDSITKALVFDGLVKVAALDTTELVQHAQTIHGTSPVATVALGKVLTVAAYMANEMKGEDDRLSISVQCDGPLQNIVVAANAKGVRGYVSTPNVVLPPLGNGKQNLAKAIGGGTISVRKDLGLKDCYTGQSQLVNGSIDQDFAWYFTSSEGQPTALALAVNLDETGRCTSAGGVIVQPMPGCPDSILVMLEDIAMNFADIDRLVALRDAHRLVDDYFGHFTIEYFEPTHPVYRCICSPAYMQGVVRSIGRGECVNILMERGSIEIVCHFCNTRYTYDKEQVIAIWQAYDKAQKEKKDP